MWLYQKECQFCPFYHRLQELKDLRDKEIQKVLAPAPEGNLGMDSKNKPVKKVQQPEDLVVQIEVPNEMNTKISILCPSKKPTIDLQVALVEDQPTAVFEYLSEDLKELQIDRPAKKPRRVPRNLFNRKRLKASLPLMARQNSHGYC